MTSNLTASYKHICTTVNDVNQKVHFCQFCGIQLLRTSLNFGNENQVRVAELKSGKSERVIRSLLFEKRDTHGSMSANVLSQMIKKQTKNRYYNIKPYHLPYRQRVLSWMQTLVTKFKYQQSTLHLAIGYFDSVLSLYTVTIAQIKLIAYICLFIGAKMEEKEEKIPLIEEAFKFFDKEFTPTEILNCEKQLVKILDYQLNLKTPYCFITYFLSRGSLLSSELPCEYKSVESQLRFAAQFEQLVLLLIDHSLNNYEFYKFTSLAVACAAIALARKVMKIPNEWSRQLEDLTRLSWSAVKECLQLLEKEASKNEFSNFSSPDKGKMIEETATEENSPAQVIEDKQTCLDQVNAFRITEEENLPNV